MRKTSLNEWTADRGRTGDMDWLSVVINARFLLQSKRTTQFNLLSLGLTTTFLFHRPLFLENFTDITTTLNITADTRRTNLSRSLQGAFSVVCWHRSCDLIWVQKSQEGSAPDCSKMAQDGGLLWLCTILINFDFYAKITAQRFANQLKFSVLVT